MSETKKNKRILTGTVVSNKAEKTVSVLVTRKYLAHDENNEFAIGDVVRIQECAPISKRKKWFVKEKVATNRS
jgi:small subunit ribosomal protein S17